jgi:hypothetical protein
MMKYFSKKASVITATIMAASLLSACGSSSDDDDEMMSYEISVTNLSSNQPLSPVAAQLHNSNFKAWQVGSMASEALEVLAEGGDNSSLLALGSGDVYSALSGTGAIMPGVSETLTIESGVYSDINLTLVTMLVNTNDAFAGKTQLDLSELMVGDSQKHYLPVYDAGTEGNSELDGTIPGPIDGGEGFNMARDDVDYVARHPGVVGVDHGYSESVLNSTHGFDSPVALLTITRTQ